MRLTRKTAIIAVMIAGLALTGCAEQKLEYSGVTPEIANEKVQTSAENAFKEFDLDLAPLTIEGDAVKTYKVGSKDVETLSAQTVNNREANYNKFIELATKAGWNITEDNSESIRFIAMEKDNYVAYVRSTPKDIPGVDEELMQHSITVNLKGLAE